MAQFLSVGWFLILHRSDQLSLPPSQHHKMQGLQAGPGGARSAVSAFWEAKACLGYELKVSIGNSARSSDHIKSRTGLGMKLCGRALGSPVPQQKQAFYYIHPASHLFYMLLTQTHHRQLSKTGLRSRIRKCLFGVLFSSKNL